jgi:uncharacterized repeat protein (TIGR01451 family)
VTATDAGTPENSAIVQSTTPDPNPRNNEDHTTTTTDRKADLEIDKTASAPVVTNGEAFDYLVKITNHGPSRATGATVTDTVPDRLRIDSVSSSRGACSTSGQTVNCDLGTLASGASATVRITVLTTKAGSYTNTASTTSEVPDPNPSNNTDSADVQVSAKADLAIAKAVGASTALVGDTITYGMTVTNRGPDDASDVTVTDPLPAGASFVSAKPSTGTCAIVAGALACDLGAVADGASVAIQVKVKLTQAGDVHNVAQVTSPTPDPDKTNNQAGTGTTTEQADISVTKSASTARPVVGRAVTYTIAVRNAGPSTAHGVVVTDPLPEGLQYVSAKASAGSCVSGQGAVVCDVGDVAANGTATIAVQAIARRIGGQGNTASAVTRGAGDPNTANNVAGVRVSGRTPRLSLRKTASRHTVSAGGRITFELRVRNRGASTAHRVTVCDRMPSGLVYVASRSRARFRQGSYCWTLSSLAPGRSRTYTITAKALRGASGRRVNAATATAADAPQANATRAITIRAAPRRAAGVTG